MVLGEGRCRSCCWDSKYLLPRGTFSGCWNWRDPLSVCVSRILWPSVWLECSLRWGVGAILMTRPGWEASICVFRLNVTYFRAWERTLDLALWPLGGRCPYSVMNCKNQQTSSSRFEALPRVKITLKTCLVGVCRRKYESYTPYVPAMESSFLCSTVQLGTRSSLVLFYLVVMSLVSCLRSNILNILVIGISP